MGAFELQDTRNVPAETVELHSHVPTPPKKVKDECIVAYKIYDSCRRQNCLTANELGPARYAVSGCCDGQEYQAGETIRIPDGATSVTMDKLQVEKIHVIDKKPCPFRNGFWDIGIKYTFSYNLTFRDSGGCFICEVEARNFFNSKTTLFGSSGGDIIVGTDLFSRDAESITFEAAPFMWIEAKAIGLEARLHHHRGGGEHRRGEVLVTIGLFSILKLFRLVHLNVQSTGFCVPEECEDTSHDINPCEYFADLAFPMDIFSPPQRKEFRG